MYRQWQRFPAQTATFLQVAQRRRSHHCTGSNQDAIAVLYAMEVASPNTMLELVFKTEMKTGTIVPRGRTTLPRPPKPKTEDLIRIRRGA
jgi:hypothetical protein